MSERLAAQFARLEEDRQQLRMILGGMVEGVVAIDAGQCVRFANDRAAALLDFHAPVAVGRKLWEVIANIRGQDLVANDYPHDEPYRQAQAKDETNRRRALPESALLLQVLVLGQDADIPG